LSTDPLLFEKSAQTHIARLTFNRVEKLNAMTIAMYDQLEDHLDEIAQDDTIKVLILRGAGGVFTTGQDLSEAYDWYGENEPKDGKRRRPSQRRRLAVDRRTNEKYHKLIFFNKAVIVQAERYALGGGFEFLLSADISIVGRGTKIGMPAARFLGPILGNLHLFFHRLGPVRAKDLLLTGRIATVDEWADQGVFTSVVSPEAVADETERMASLVARMPADGITIAKEAYRLVEQSMGMGLSEVFSYMLHAYGTNLRFEPDEFNFVRTRADEGMTRTFELRDEFFGDEHDAPGQSGS
jgi:enoyl-CoA hydratase/carnithine racemase